MQPNIKNIKRILGRATAFVLVGAALGSIGSVIFALFFPGVYPILAPRGDSAFSFVLTLGVMGALAGAMVGLCAAFDGNRSAGEPGTSVDGSAEDLGITPKPRGPVTQSRSRLRVLATDPHRNRRRLPNPLISGGIDPWLGRGQRTNTPPGRTL